MFDTWLDTFVEEKGLDIDHVFEVVGKIAVNDIPLGVVVEHMKIATRKEQEQIKVVLVQIDFLNGDVMDFFNHLAKAIAY